MSKHTPAITCTEDSVLRLDLPDVVVFAYGSAESDSHVVRRFDRDAAHENHHGRSASALLGTPRTRFFDAT